MSDVAVITIPAEEWREQKAMLRKISETLNILTKESQKELMTKKEVCECLKIGSSTFERYVQNGTLTFIRMNDKTGSKRYIRRSEIDSKMNLGLI